MDYTKIPSIECLIHTALTKDVENEVERERGKSEITHKMIIDSLDSIASKVKVVCDYDIPYVAGYSQSGETVYIDRHMPETENDNDGNYPIRKLLVAHETIEKALIDEYKVHYLVAHQIALVIEQTLTEALGLDWKIENEIMQKYVKEIDKENLSNCPSDLDLTPYQDEDDYKKIKEMLKAE